MNTIPKTVFCDIDGTLLRHTGDILLNMKLNEVLPNVNQTIRQWDRNNYRIILTTGRKESTRQQTVDQLKAAGIVYDQLIMGLPNGPRVIINDKKEKGIENTAYAVNLVRNSGLDQLDLTSKNMTVPDSLLFERIDKSWGYEQLIECNDKYAVKKIFMVKDSCSIVNSNQLKRFTLTIFSGQLDVSTGESPISIESKLYVAGESVTVKPQTYYKIKALEDCLYFESSSNELWEGLKI